MKNIFSPVGKHTTISVSCVIMRKQTRDNKHKTDISITIDIHVHNHNQLLNPFHFRGWRDTKMLK